MRYMACKLVCAAVAVTSVVEAQAATISAVTGTAIVNRGQGFGPLVVGAAVIPGDQVSVAPGGSVKITLNDGAVAMIGPGKVYTVPANGALPAGAMGAVPAVPPVVVAVVPPPPPPAPGLLATMGPTGLAVAGVAGIAAGTAIYVKVQQLIEQKKLEENTQPSP